MSNLAQTAVAAAVGHALLSPSGAHRWMNCPASVEAEAPFPRTSSVYADEGTRAHTLGELCLSRGKDTTDPEIEGLAFRDWESAEIRVDEDMQYYVQTYVDHVRELVAESSTSILLVEQRLPLDQYIPDAFGTCDAIVFQMEPGRPVRGIVVDLKYGMGERVSAVENPQLMLYALGVDQEHGPILEVEEWELQIVQPRLDTISRWTISAADLREWGRTKVIPAAARALQPNAEFIPGEKQCRWCKAKAVCKARADHAQAIARSEFLDAPMQMLTVEEIGKILPRLGQLEAWAKDVREYAHVLATSGVAIPGYKLVEGRSNRAWTDQMAAARALLDAGLSVDKVYKLPTVIGIPDAEKALKALGHKPEQVLSGLIIKPAGTVNLVAEADPRPAITRNSAAADFDETDTTVQPWE